MASGPARAREGLRWLLFSHDATWLVMLALLAGIAIKLKIFGGSP